MRISDLSAPVSAAKADWLPSETWMGFSPQGQGPDAKEKCESAIKRQFGNGYVIERVTTDFGSPNAAFSDHPRIVADREHHAECADCLVHVHKLKPSALPLAQIIGGEEYEFLQDAWSTSDQRARWSVAFPIIERFEIVGQPKARVVFSDYVFKRLFQKQSAGLRLLDDNARAQIANLEIQEIDAPNWWIAAEQEILAAELSELNPKALSDLEQDLDGALEGHSEERRVKLIKRATWLADRFVAGRKRDGTLICDQCQFDPKRNTHILEQYHRTCFDVHHKKPLNEGKRLTTTADFALLCPTCHRIEHLILDGKQSGNAKTQN